MIVKGLQNELKEKPVEEHVYSVLMESKTGQESSVGQHLHYKYSLKTAFALADHGYCKKPLFDADIISIEKNKVDTIKFYIDKNNGIIQTHGINIKTNNTSCIKQCLSDTVHQNILEIMQPHSAYEGFKDLEVKKSLNEQILNGDTTVNIDVSYLVAPKPCGSNYIDVKQNTQEWHDYRKFKITASRLAYLLGLL